MALTFVCRRCGLVVVIDDVSPGKTPCRCPNCKYIVYNPRKEAM